MEEAKAGGKPIKGGGIRLSLTVWLVFVVTYLLPLNRFVHYGNVINVSQ